MSKQVFCFFYVLKNTAGEVIDQSDEGSPISFLEGAGQIIPGLERQIVGLKKGDKKTVNVAASEAYGERDDSLIAKVERSQLPTDSVKVGDVFRGGPDEDAPILTVTEVTATHVVVDANHPLAGEDLVFSIEMGDIRSATAEELTHGHAHGPGGHHHH